MKIRTSSLPDLWRLVDDFNVALEELLDCAGPARV